MSLFANPMAVITCTKWIPYRSHVMSVLQCICSRIVQK